MTHITIDERISARDLEPLIDSQWVGQAADILRFDRSYADAAEWLARFNQEKDRLTSHADTKVVDFDLEARRIGANVNIPLLMDLNSTMRALWRWFLLGQSHYALAFQRRLIVEFGVPAWYGLMSLFSFGAFALVLLVKKIRACEVVR